MVFFCQHCFKEIPQDATLCPYCGADIKTYDARSFEDKLIQALKHPIPETVGIAIAVLGKIRSIRAIKPLKKLFSTSSDPYIQKEILDALFVIGGKEAEGFVKKCFHMKMSSCGKKQKCWLRKWYEAIVLAIAPFKNFWLPELSPKFYRLTKLFILSHHYKFYSLMNDAIFFLCSSSAEISRCK